MATPQGYRRFLLVALLFFAGATRFADLDWDQGHAFHPDERAIVFAVQRLSFDPLQLNPGFFAYGSLPIYVIRGVTSLAGLAWPALRDDFNFILLVGRAASALTGVVTVFLLYRLGVECYGSKVGLLAAGLLAACVLHVQQSRFMTADGVLTAAVLVALLLCLSVVRRGRLRDYAAAGAAVGLALAVKLSAAPLLAPLAVAAWFRLPADSPPTVARRAAVAIAAAAMAFMAAEPYAVLDAGNFWRQVSEQGAMVGKAGLLPYTVQYMGTPKYAYDLGQMVLWGMGPALGLAVLMGAGAQLVALRRARDPGTLVLLAFVVPYVAITGAFEVKFLRYLLPAYPILILWAAAWLWRRAKADRAGGWLLVSVAGATLLSALAYLSVYRGPHTVVRASQWVYANVPAGRTLLSQHWDEGFPLPLPEGQPDRYRVVDFPYYDPDTAEKAHDLARELSAADYVVLPTRRVYGAVTRAPDRYPIMNRYFRLLFAGDLGFVLAHEEASRPRLLGLEAPDELADESFTVYDHPKVLLFRNAERLDPAQLEALILTGVPSRVLSRTDLLLFDGRQGDVPPASKMTVRSSGLAFLAFAAVLQALSLSGWMLAGRLLPRAGGYAAAKVLGPLVFAYLSWLLPHALPGSFTPAVLTWLFLALVGGALLAWWHAGAPAAPAGWRTVEALFWGSFSLFALLRSLSPAVFWGEKPMDFALLNAIIRSTSLPPPEPWLSGSTLAYTYFGHFLVAALGKLCRIDPGITFNLGVALAGALTATAAFAVGLVLGGNRRAGLCTAVLTTFAGNLSGPIELWRRRAIDFDYFWATSRIFPDTITEYPFWSFVFADLHAHVLALPFSLIFLALALQFSRAPSARLLFGLSLTLGAVAVTSGWSIPTYALFLPFLLTFAAPSLGRGVLRAAAVGLGVAATAAFLYLPFWPSYRAPERRWGWETGSFADAAGYAEVFGLFLAVGLAFLIARWRRARTPSARWVASPFALAALACLGVGVAGSVRVALLGLGVLTLVLARRATVAARHRRIAAVFAFALFVTAGCDVVYVWDRMNTVFKFYMDAWLFFAAGAGALLPALWRTQRIHGSRILARAPLLLLLGMAGFTAASGAIAMARFERVPSGRPTLRGTAYLALRDENEARAIDWLNSQVPGLPVVAEAWGEAYGDFARVSMNTGLPTVLGWEYHVFQRGQAWPEIEARKQDLARLYTSDNREEVAAILGRYRVGLVYVGALERRTYGEGIEERFAAWPDLLAPAYRNPEVTVLATARRAPVLASPAPKAVADAGPESPPLGRLGQPRGVAVDDLGQVYVADFEHDGIQKFTSGLEPLAAWGGAGPGPGRFRQPCAVAVAGTRLYVADTWNERVQVLDVEGRFQAEWTGNFYGPRGIAVGAEGRVYVSDTGNHRVRIFDRDGHEAPGFGGPGEEPGRFREPMGIATDKKGRVYVCDNGNGRLQIFDAAGGFERMFPVPGWRTEAFSEPTVVVVAGRIWVTVPLEGALRAYDRDGGLLREIRGSPTPGGDGAFTRPWVSRTTREPASWWSPTSRDDWRESP